MWSWYNCVNVYSTSLSKSVGTAVEVDEMEAEECRIARELCCDVVVDGTESDLSDIEGESDFEALPVDVPDDSDADDVALVLSSISLACYMRLLNRFVYTCFNLLYFFHKHMFLCTLHQAYMYRQQVMALEDSCLISVDH